MIKEYDTGYEIGDTVVFKVDGEEYKGKVDYFVALSDNSPEVKVSITSGNLNFIRNIHDIREYIEVVNNDYKDASYYLEDGRFYISADVVTIPKGKLIDAYGKFSIDLDEGKVIIMTEEQTSFETENGANYHIFDCDCNEGAFHIEISPDYQWDKDDIWELVNTLLKKIGELDENGEIVEPEVDKDHDEKLTNGGDFDPYEFSIAFSDLSEEVSDYISQMGETCKKVIEDFRTSQENLVSEKENKQKPVFVVTYEGYLSEDQIKTVRKNIKEQLDEGNIDANPVILSDGMKGYFENLK